MGGLRKGEQNKEGQRREKKDVTVKKKVKRGRESERIDYEKRERKGILETKGS